MKKLFFMLIGAFMFSVALADDRPIDYSQFPQNAKNFITKHFAKAKVLSATIDEEFTSTEYTAYLDNGVKVEFNKVGEWKKVDCGIEAVPTAIIPAKITSYVSQNYSGIKIVKIDKDGASYDVDLSNGLEAKFDLQGNFLRLDD